MGPCASAAGWGVTGAAKGDVTPGALDATCTCDNRLSRTLYLAAAGLAVVSATLGVPEPADAGAAALWPPSEPPTSEPGCAAFAALAEAPEEEEEEEEEENVVGLAEAEGAGMDETTRATARGPANAAAASSSSCPDENEAAMHFSHTFWGVVP